MSMNVSDFVWQRLQEWGLKRVYGYPGDGVGGLDVALEKAKDIMQYVQVRHEEMAAFMASAHAKFTGEVGLCYATSGPGAIHLLNGLYDAKMDHVPVVAIVGQQARTALGAQLSAGSRPADPCSRTWPRISSRLASVPGQVRHLIDRAVRIASTKRTVTCVILPNDLQELRLRRSAGGARHDPHRRRLCRPGDAAGRRTALREAADGAQRGQESRDAGRRGRARRHRRGDRGRRAASGRRRQGAARQGRRCRTTCPASPARSACSAPSRPGT